MKTRTTLTALLIITLIAATALSGCIDGKTTTPGSSEVTPPPNKDKPSVSSNSDRPEIQYELVIPEGLVARLEEVKKTDWGTYTIKGNVTNPTNVPVEMGTPGVGVFCEYIDGDSGERKWSLGSVYAPPPQNILEPGMTASFYSSTPHGTVKIQPYIKLRDNTEYPHGASLYVRYGEDYKPGSGE